MNIWLSKKKWWIFKLSFSNNAVIGAIDTYNMQFYNQTRELTKVTKSISCWSANPSQTQASLSHLSCEKDMTEKESTNIILFVNGIRFPIHTTTIKFLLWLFDFAVTDSLLCLIHSNFPGTQFPGNQTQLIVYSVAYDICASWVGMMTEATQNYPATGISMTF